MWWGKVIGSAIGFYPAGPAGMFTGFMLGHLLDRLFSRLKKRSVRKPGADTHSRFFQATFQFMGHLAKAKGRVDESDIDFARSVMDRLGLNQSQRQQAMAYYSEGKRPDFDREQRVKALRQWLKGQPQLVNLFLETQIAAAYADGKMGSTDQEVLGHLSKGLKVTSVQFKWLHARVIAQQRASVKAAASGGVSVREAYALLGVTANQTDEEIKQAYRRAMSKNHPDKLMAQGLPENMQRLATEKVQEIQTAHHVIVTDRQRRRRHGS